MLNKLKNEPALISGAVEAILGLLLAFGVHLSNTQTGAIMAVVGAALAFFVRSQVVPTNQLANPTNANPAVDPNLEGGYVYSPFAVIVVVLLVLILLAVFGVLHLHLG